MKKRYIFDLDCTLLTTDFTKTDGYFVDVFGEPATDFSANVSKHLHTYEMTHRKYDMKSLSEYLTMVSGLDINEKVINDWISELTSVLDFKEEEVERVLDTLKRQDKSLAVLTNWIASNQIPRLERAGLIDYFDEIYTGDQVLKPHKESYITAAKGYNPQKVLFIGDNVDLDYIGPKSCGYEAILYDKKDIHHKTLKKVKKLSEILTRE